MISQVEKLMNRLLYNQYKLKKASMSQSATEVERTLYHGTSETSVKEICVHGFNRSFCGKNGMTSRSNMSLLSYKLVMCILLLYTFFACWMVIMVSLHSHCVWSRGLFRCELDPVCPGPVLTPQCRWIQVYICNQSADGGLH